MFREGVRRERGGERPKIAFRSSRNRRCFFGTQKDFSSRNKHHDAKAKSLGNKKKRDFAFAWAKKKDLQSRGNRVNKASPVRGGECWDEFSDLGKKEKPHHRSENRKSWKRRLSQKVRLGELRIGRKKGVPEMVDALKRKGPFGLKGERVNRPSTIIRKGRNFSDPKKLSPIKRKRGRSPEEKGGFAEG